jgi:hypothetical protein
MTVTGEVEGHDATAFREVSHLVVPKVTVTSPTVDEQQYRFAVAFDPILDGNTIRRGNRSVEVGT